MSNRGDIVQGLCTYTYMCMRLVGPFCRKVMMGHCCRSLGPETAHAFNAEGWMERSEKRYLAVFTLE